MVVCANCYHEFEGKYCSQCGQKASVRRFEVKAILHDLPHSLFHLERGIIKNVLSIRSPGYAVRSYLGGQRVGFFNPVLFFFLTTGLIIFTESAIHKDTHWALDIVVAKNIVFDAGQFVEKYLRFIYLISAFLFAQPTYRIFGRKSGFNYAENVVINVFVLGYSNLLYLLFIWPPSSFIFPLTPVMGVSYFIFCMAVFRDESFLISALKSLFVLVCQVMLFLLLVICTGIIGACVNYLLFHFGA